MDFNKYIGIPFEPKGRDINKGVDCFGLVKAVLKNEFGRDLPDWIDNENADFSGFKKIDKPGIGSIGLFNFAGVPVHIGLYIGDNRVLHVTPFGFTVAERLDSRRLQGRLNGWYD